jgi:Replication initiator protein A
MEAATANQPMDEHAAWPDTRRGHDEMNLAEFPLVLLSKRAPEGKHTIEYQDYGQHPRTGAPVLRKVTITGAGKHGLPTTHDEDVMMALIFLTLTGKRADANDERTIWFNRRELLDLLGWADNGEYYQRLKTSLRRWKGVSIYYENWWDPISNDYVTEEEGFSLLDHYQFRDGRRTDSPQLDLPLDDTQPQRMLCSITWNRKIFNSFKTGYLTTLDLDTFLSLPTPAAKRAYRFLNLHLPASGFKDFDLETFACQHVGYTKYKPARLRSKVQETIVEPLEKHEFIEPMPATRRFLKQNGEDRIVFARKAPATLPAESSPASASSTPTASPLLDELKRRGLGGKLAAQFIAAHPAEYIEQKIDYLDFELTRKPPAKPVAWLRKAIEDDYGPPPDYQPRAERERQKDAAASAARMTAETHRRLRQQNLLEEAERKAINAYIDQLDPAERTTLEAEALATASTTERETYDSPVMAKFRDTLLLGMLRTHVARKLAAEAIPAEA